MSERRGLYMRGKGEVPVLYVGLNFHTDGLKLRTELRAELSVRLNVELLALSAKQFHRKQPKGSAFLITLPLTDEEKTIKRVVECIKKAYSGIELTYEADLSESESWNFTGIVMEFRRNGRSWK